MMYPGALVSADHVLTAHAEVKGNPVSQRFIKESLSLWTMQLASYLYMKHQIFLGALDIIDIKQTSEN